MKNGKTVKLLLLLAMMTKLITADACTSVIVSGRADKNLTEYYSWVDKYIVEQYTEQFGIEF
jgi:hypothetical protein